MEVETVREEDRDRITERERERGALSGFCPFSVLPLLEYHSYQILGSQIRINP